MASNCLEHLRPARQGTQRMGNPTALSDQFQTALPGRGSVEPWCLLVLFEAYHHGALSCQEAYHHGDLMVI
jgi:hypothetical protein